MLNKSNKPHSEAVTHVGPANRYSRRSVIKKTLSATAVVGVAAQRAHAKNITEPGLNALDPAYGFGGLNNGHPVFGEPAHRRAFQAFRLRFEAAKYNLTTPRVRQETNGDEGNFDDYRACYSKALPHDSLGEVSKPAYRQLLKGLSRGSSNALDRVPLGGDRLLANPLGSYKHDLSGRDGQATYMRPAPAFLSRETSAEMGELYWKAMARDVPFANYETDHLIAAAVTDLNAFDETVGPKEDGAVTSGAVFRGETPGDLEGPYISQFLFKDIPFGNHTIVQKYVTPAPSDDYMMDIGSWLAVQNGVAPGALSKGNARYISDARALGEFVHQDFSYQSYLSAALIMSRFPGALDVGNFYNTAATQGGFTSLGGPDVLDLVGKAANLSLTGAWYQKWLVHRRARPEVYAGRLHHQVMGAKDYGIPDEIINCEGVARTKTAKGSYLLPQAFPEGSPTHPSYPAGHATIAGACSTVLKAFFEESYIIPDPVVSDSSGSTLLPYAGELTLGGELNKLANNIALGRDWAGVHYRSDGVDGLLVGEQQAIDMLADYSRVYRERFGGYTLTKFNGERIQIQNGKVTPYAGSGGPSIFSLRREKSRNVKALVWE